MASIPTKSFASITQTIAAGIQGRARAILDFTVGSSLRAISEGVSGILLWLQAIALQVLALTRASTSTGVDLDSWMADWNFVRIGGTAATGLVTFSRLSVGSSAPFIPLGATVQSADGTQAYTIVADLTNTYYTGTPVAGYTMPANVASITVPVQAILVGAAGNIVSGALNQIATPLVGIDTVVNAATFTNGSDAEKDQAFRSRFIGYIAALQKGTVAAILYSITSIQNGLQATVLENVNSDGSTNNGFVTVTVDDGSGAPPSSVINSAALAVGAVRASGVLYGVFAPVVLTANIAISITTGSGYDHGTVVSVVGSAVTSFVNALPLGTSLYFNKLSQIIFEASPGVVNIPTLTVNNDRADVPATMRNVVKLGTLTVT
jgi:uncharacterized phage protein gp47/JayE